MTTTMNINEMLKAIENEGTSYFGVRGFDEPFELGEYLENSFDWDHDDWDYENDRPAEYELNGTCATRIDINEILFETEEDKANYINEIIEFNQDYYQYDHMAVIVGDDETYGDDEREVILENAKVVYVIK